MCCALHVQNLPNYLQYANIAPMYTILFTKQADRALRKMPRNVAARIRKKLDQVAADPYAKHSHVTELQNRPGYRLRVGNGRVIYEIDGGRIVVLVLKIARHG